MGKGNKPRKKSHDFTNEDNEWYDEHIPNPITRDMAIKIHTNLGWDAIRNSLLTRRPFGISKVRDGSKRDMAFLLAQELTGATSLVAACDNVGGFNKKGVPYGSNCDIFLNGKKIATVDNIVGTDVQNDKGLGVLRGLKQGTEKITDDYRVKLEGSSTGGVELPSGLKYSVRTDYIPRYHPKWRDWLVVEWKGQGRIKSKKIDRLKGVTVLNLDPEKKAELVWMNNPIQIGTNTSKLFGGFTFSVKEKANKDDEKTVFPCRAWEYKRKKGGAIVIDKYSEKIAPDPIVKDTLSYQCVNWVKIMDKKDARKRPLLL